jgi:glutamate-1-semialdehyde 2,1-aminomutase
MQVTRLKEIYKKKTRLSRNLYTRSTNIFPGGVSHNIRYFEPYPFFTTRARGKYLYDVDDNKYTDYWMGHWALILGHSPVQVVRDLSNQIRHGVLYGTANDISLRLGEYIQKLMPKAESMRFSNSGSEATMYAVRVARAKTKRRVIAKIIGGWHGYNTTLLQTVNYPFEVNEGMGLIPQELRFVKSIPFNDLERSLELLRPIKHDLACIIVEPLLAGSGCVPPVEGYLQGLEEFSHNNESLFILDEIVTGFRLSIQGAAQKFKLNPDLFTLGKVVGGGLPIGVLCGKKEIMSICDPTLRVQKDERCAIGGGTYSANPITMTAGLSTLRYIDDNRNVIYSKIDKLGEYARNGLAKIFTDAKLNVEITGMGSLFLVHFLNSRVGRIASPSDVALSDRAMLVKYHFELLAKHGIFFLPSKMGAFSFAHAQTDVNRMLEATTSIIESGALK